jgi:hypothetical protein
MCRSAGRRDAVPQPGRQVGGGREAREVRRARRGDGCLFMRTPRSHLDARALCRRHDHAGGRGGNRSVVVEDRERERLEYDALGEGRVHGEDGRAGEVELALCISADVTAEPVARQPFAGRFVDDTCVGKKRELGVVVPKGCDRLDQPRRPRNHAVAAALGQPPGEELERAPAPSRAVTQRCLEHGQLVVIGEQGRVSRPAGIVLVAQGSARHRPSLD